MCPQTLSICTCLTSYVTSYVTSYMSYEQSEVKCGTTLMSSNCKGGLNHDCRGGFGLVDTECGTRRFYCSSSYTTQKTCHVNGTVVVRHAVI